MSTGCMPRSGYAQRWLQRQWYKQWQQTAGSHNDQQHVDKKMFNAHMVCHSCHGNCMRRTMRQQFSYCAMNVHMSQETMSPLRLIVAHRPLKHPVIVRGGRHLVHGKEVFADESIAIWIAVWSGVITICKGIPKQVEPEGAGCGIYQN